LPNGKEGGGREGGLRETGANCVEHGWGGPKNETPGTSLNGKKREKHTKRGGLLGEK